MAHLGSIHAEQLRRAGIIATHTHPLVVELREGIRDLEEFYRGELHERDLRITSLEDDNRALSERLAFRDRVHEANERSTT